MVASVETEYADKKKDRCLWDLSVRRIRCRLKYIPRRCNVRRPYTQ